MTMQVSKGEFDRRVKLLEQKVQESANKLMSDYKTFVERVNAVVSENGDFNQYAAIVDRINSCFDTNGQFDGSHIAPLSIETAALSVGQRSQALNLKNAKFTVNDYTSGYGVLNITDENGGTTGNGLLTHYTLFNNSQGEPIGDATFSISYGNKNLASSDALQYIYAKLPCTKADDGTYIYDNSGGNPSSDIVVDVNQRTIEYNFNTDHKLWILLGTISKKFTRQASDGTNYNYRIIDLIYGLTTINGRLITTGRIKGTDNDSAYFDLDEGEIGGKINFVSSGISNYLSDNKYTTTTYVDGQKVVSEKIYMAHAGTSKPNISNVPIPSERAMDITTTFPGSGNYWQREKYEQGYSADPKWSLKPSTSTYAHWYYTCTQTYKLNSDNSLVDGSLTFSKIEFDEMISIYSEALQGSTTIDGGLILTKVVKTGSGSSTAVLDGTSVGPCGFWTGADSYSNAPARIHKNGFAYFSDIQINNSNFSIQTTNFDYFNSMAIKKTFTTDVAGDNTISIERYNVSGTESYLRTISGKFTQGYSYCCKIKYTLSSNPSSILYKYEYITNDNKSRFAEISGVTYNSVYLVSYVAVRDSIKNGFNIYGNGFYYRSIDSAYGGILFYKGTNGSGASKILYEEDLDVKNYLN